MDVLQQIACESSDFEYLIERNQIYVDKTALIYRIASDEVHHSNFISWPRRFGKSLACSTFRALFEGNGSFLRDLP